MKTNQQSQGKIQAATTTGVESFKSYIDKYHSASGKIEVQAPGAFCKNLVGLDSLYPKRSPYWAPGCMHIKMFKMGW